MIYNTEKLQTWGGSREGYFTEEKTWIERRRMDSLTMTYLTLRRKNVPSYENIGRWVFTARRRGRRVGRVTRDFIKGTAALIETAIYYSSVRLGGGKIINQPIIKKGTPLIIKGGKDL